MSTTYFDFKREFTSCCARHHQGANHTEPHSVPWAKPNYRTDRTVKPIHQLLEIELLIEQKAIVGKNSIEIEALKNDTQEFSLNAVDLEIKSVTWNGQKAQFSEKNDEIIVRLPKSLNRGEKGTISLDYSVTEPRAGIYFISPDKEYPDRAVQVWTQGQDDDARYWFPCFDEPGVKFVSEMKITAPAGFICTSNGGLTKEGRTGDRWKFHWKMKFPIPAYLVTLTAGKFAEIKDTWKNIPVNYLVEQGREDEGKRSFGKTPQMLELFSEKLGFPYPYEKYHQIAVSEFTFGGMENTTATTQTDATLHPKDMEPDFTSEDLVSHELAHQWFGDLVTCKSWSHGWLNESWATFMETVFKEKDLGEDETQYYRYEELQIYLSEDSSVYRRPIVTNVYSDPAEIWDRHLYQKGGLILNLLRAELGPEDFWKGTKLYLERHQGQAVETIDFQRALEEVSQRPLDWFFDQWIFKAGHPEIKVGFEWDSKNKMAKVRLEQTQKKDALTPIHQINSFVELFFDNGKSQKVSMVMDQTVKNLIVPLEKEPLAMRFDSENRVLKTVQWDLSEKMIGEQLKLAGDVVGKIWAMKTLAKKGTIKGQELLAERLKSDPFWGVRKEAAIMLGKITSQRAFYYLCEALKSEKDNRVRSGLATALGSFRTDDAFEKLVDLTKENEPTMVRAKAAEALGKTRNKKSIDHLTKLLNVDSWRDLVKAYAYKGLGLIGDEKVVPMLIEGCHYGAAKWARPTAIRALGGLSKDQRNLDSLMIDLLKDPFSQARYAALDAIVERGQRSALGAIDQLAHSTVDGHLKFAAHLAAKNLRKGDKEKEEIKNIKESVEKLVKENNELKDRLEILESRIDGTNRITN